MTVPDRFKNPETVAAIVLTAIIVAFHLVRVFAAGALWRDEAAAVQLATLPSFSNVASHFQHEAFPLLFPATVRTYAAIVGNTDLAWRVFGMLVGLAVIAALWINMRVIAGSVPLLSLALLGFNGAFIQWGDSIRGYGLGIVFLLLSIACFWLVLEGGSQETKLLSRPSSQLLSNPTKASTKPFAATGKTREIPVIRGQSIRIALGVVCVVASVQCLLHNAILIAAICIAAVAVSLRRGAERLPYVLVCIGLAAPVSLLPYLPNLHEARKWDMVVRWTTTLQSLASKANDAFASSGWWNTWAWVLLVVGGLGTAFYRRQRRKQRILPEGQIEAVPVPVSSRPSRPGGDVLVFAGIALFIGIVTYFAFLLILSYATQPWYYLALMATAAVLVDLLWSSSSSFSSSTPRSTLHALRLTLALLIAATCFLSTVHHVLTRQTNIDVVASELARQATKSDLVVVTPWYNAISFQRYYHGVAPWMTVPPIDFHLFHRYDLIKELMIEPDQNEPVRPLLAKIAETLQAGHRVWVAGELANLRPGQPLPDLPGAPDQTWGWQNEAYLAVWLSKMTAYLDARAKRRQDIKISLEGHVNRFENLDLRMFEGW